jgi:hypothetical protein
MLLALAGTAGAQEDPPMLECGNAFYDDGTAVGFDWFDGGEAGDPDKMFAVRFDLADFSYEPGMVELVGICAGNLLSVGGLFPNDVFVYPDLEGLPDDSVELARGQILTGNGVNGASIVMFDEPVTIDGDFWLVNRGDASLATTDFNMEHDEAPPEEPEEQHSFTSSEGIANLEPATVGDYMLRAYLQPIERSYLTPGMARVGGINQTEWRSTYSVLNTGDRVVEAAASFISGEDVTTITGPVGPGQLVVWDDVVADLFGIEDEISGSIELDADGPLVVSARTYNIRDEGTVGQYFPGFEAEDGLIIGQLGIVSQLVQNQAYRTNLGYLNLGDDFCRVETTLYDPSGLQVGEARIRRVEAGEWRQINNIFIQQDAGEQDSGYAVVEVLNEGCTLWAYGSVIDSGTGDPTTIPVVVD